MHQSLLRDLEARGWRGASSVPTALPKEKNLTIQCLFPQLLSWYRTKLFTPCPSVSYHLGCSFNIYFIYVSSLFLFLPLGSYFLKSYASFLLFVNLALGADFISHRFVFSPPSPSQQLSHPCFYPISLFHNPSLLILPSLTTPTTTTTWLCSCFSLTPSVQQPHCFLHFSSHLTLDFLRWILLLIANKHRLVKGPFRELLLIVVSPVFLSKVSAGSSWGRRCIFSKNFRRGLQTWHI